MAVMYLYLNDKHFRKPTAEDLAKLKAEAAKKAKEGKDKAKPKKKGGMGM
jgi:hypothetical protein